MKIEVVKSDCRWYVQSPHWKLEMASKNSAYRCREILEQAFKAQDTLTTLKNVLSDAIDHDEN